MIGPNIKKLRKIKDMTQQDLAESLGVSRQAICMWETGKREIRVSTLNMLANVLDVSVGDMISVNDNGAIGHRSEDGGLASDSQSHQVRKGYVMPFKKTTKKVEFGLTAPTVKTVTLVGSFNSWNKDSNPLKKDKNGYWKTEVALKPGRHEYKFVVDGQWRTDPANKWAVRNSFGSENSVKETIL
jgi:transcriptional regulator with XRE-family HTH domain